MVCVHGLPPPRRPPCRAHPARGCPFQGAWALPGGFVRAGRESLDASAARELAEETGLDATQPERFHLEQLGSYGEPDATRRCPSSPWPTSPSPPTSLRPGAVACLVCGLDPGRRIGSRCPTRRPCGQSVPERNAAQDLAEPDAARRRPPQQGPGHGIDGGDAVPRPANDPAPATEPGPRALLPLAFDHARIVVDGPDRARTKIEYTPSAPAFLVEEFTIADLRGIYASTWGSPLHAGNFHRKVRSVTGFVESTGATVARGGARGCPRPALPCGRRATAAPGAAAPRPGSDAPTTATAPHARAAPQARADRGPPAHGPLPRRPHRSRPDLPHAPEWRIRDLPESPRSHHAPPVALSASGREREPAWTKETGRFGDNAPFTRKGYRIAAAWPGVSPCNEVIRGWLRRPQ
ncbi:NUDIX hydrolase [Streptomyces platensis]|uniref:NUDIX hydrolase n=1 Tax=Streptomyces platensis TaxID=58346 RepID=UPI003F639666